jgi:hypothetical protein
MRKKIIDYPGYGKVEVTVLPTYGTAEDTLCESRREWLMVGNDKLWAIDHRNSRGGKLPTAEEQFDRM